MDYSLLSFWLIYRTPFIFQDGYPNLCTTNSLCVCVCVCVCVYVCVCVCITGCKDHTVKQDIKLLLYMRLQGSNYIAQGRGGGISNCVTSRITVTEGGIKLCATKYHTLQALPNMKVLGNFGKSVPAFLTFSNLIGSQLNRVDPLYLYKKISLSLSHLVPEIIWPKVGFIFHQNQSFNHLEAFCTNFLLDFQSSWISFYCSYIFGTSFFQHLRYDWGPFFHRTVDTPFHIWWSTLSPSFRITL